jgi:hypothetical protein
LDLVGEREEAGESRKWRNESSCEESCVEAGWWWGGRGEQMESLRSRGGRRMRRMIEMK